MSGQVAAVHRRYIAGHQRLQGLRVVPVVEVAPVAFHAIEATEGVAGALQQPALVEVAEIVRRQVGQQRQSDIGRRRAMRYHRGRLFLHVVRRKPVVGLAHVGLEEGPGLAGEATQVFFLVRLECFFGQDPRSAHLPGNRRRNEPQRQHGHGQEQGQRRLGRQQRDHAQHERWCEPHATGSAGKALLALAFDLAGRRPLQQATSADEHSPQAAQHGIQAEVRFMREPAERKQYARGLRDQLAGGQRDVLFNQRLARDADQLQRERQRGRKREDAKQAEGPCHRRVGRGPAKYEQGHQRRRHQAAPQVVEDLPTGQGRQRISLAPSRLHRHPGQQPGQQLPVAANPAVAATGIGAISGWILLV